jgi:hypothetical protein
MPEAAAALGVSLATRERHWTFARARLFAELSGHGRGRRPDRGRRRSRIEERTQLSPRLPHFLFSPSSLSIVSF